MFLELPVASEDAVFGDELLTEGFGAGAAFEAVISTRGKPLGVFARILCASAGLSFLICASVSPASSTSCLRMVFVIIMGTLAEAAAGDAVEEEVGGAVMPFALLLSLAAIRLAMLVGALASWIRRNISSRLDTPPLPPPLAPFLGGGGGGGGGGGLFVAMPRAALAPHRTEDRITRRIIIFPATSSPCRLSGFGRPTVEFRSTQVHKYLHHARRII